MPKFAAISGGVSKTQIDERLRKSTEMAKLGLSAVADVTAEPSPAKVPIDDGSKVTEGKSTVVSAADSTNAEAQVESPKNAQKVNQKARKSLLPERSSGRRAPKTACCVSHCNSDERTIRADGQPLKFFDVPTDRKLRYQWTKAVPELSFAPIPSQRKICERHFIDGEPTDDHPTPELDLVQQTDQSLTTQKRKSIKEEKLGTQNAEDESPDSGATTPDMEGLISAEAANVPKTRPKGIKPEPVDPDEGRGTGSTSEYPKSGGNGSRVVTLPTGAAVSLRPRGASIEKVVSRLSASGKPLLTNMSSANKPSPMGYTLKDKSPGGSVLRVNTTSGANVNSPNTVVRVCASSGEVSNMVVRQVVSKATPGVLPATGRPMNQQPGLAVGSAAGGRFVRSAGLTPTTAPTLRRVTGNAAADQAPPRTMCRKCSDEIPLMRRSLNRLETRVENMIFMMQEMVKSTETRPKSSATLPAVETGESHTANDVHTEDALNETQVSRRSQTRSASAVSTTSANTSSRTSPKKKPPSKAASAVGSIKLPLGKRRRTSKNPSKESLTLGIPLPSLERQQHDEEWEGTPPPSITPEPPIEENVEPASKRPKWGKNTSRAAANGVVEQPQLGSPVDDKPPTIDGDDEEEANGIESDEAPPSLGQPNNDPKHYLTKAIARTLLLADGCHLDVIKMKKNSDAIWMRNVTDDKLENVVRSLMSEGLLGFSERTGKDKKSMAFLEKGFQKVLINDENAKQLVARLKEYGIVQQSYVDACNGKKE